MAQDKMHITTAAYPPAGAADLGVVYGSCCYSKNIIADTLSSIKNSTVGGELSMFTELIDEGVRVALSRLEEKAAAMGAHGVYGVQIATPQVTNGAAEVVAYGTAFVIAPRS